MKRLFPLILVLAQGVDIAAAEEWLEVLNTGLRSEYSQTRHDALKQVDVSSAKSLRILWKVLDGRGDPLVIDWYVRQGAQEALAKVEAEEAMEEIERLLKDKGYPYSKETVVYSVIHKIRVDFIRDYGGSDDKLVEEAKKKIRKTRGLEYIAMMLPRLGEFDPGGRRYGWLKLAFDDEDSRVRLAALNGFLAYPQTETIPLLIDNMARLKELEKKSRRNEQRNYREWVMNRFVLEQLSGQYYRDVVEDWQQWWTVAKDQFSLEKRVEEELADEEGKEKGKTIVVRRGGVEVKVNMKIAGRPDGYPLLVLPWRGYEPDYFRPWFHGIEEFLRVYYLYMPRIGDFKGLARRGESNIPNYPTEKLAEALSGYMEETGLESFAVMGHGPAACTLAMHLTSSHQEQVSHLILINPTSAGNKYGQVLDNVKRVGRSRKNSEVVKGVDNLLIKSDGKPKYEPADDAEKGGLGRALNNLKFADPTAPEIGTLDFLFEQPGGMMVMNDSTWSLHKIFGKRPPRIPVLVCMGEKDPWAPKGEVQGVAKFFRAELARFRDAAQMPFLFDTYAFTKYVEGFFKRHDPEKMKKSSRRSKKSSRRTKAD